MNKKETRNLEEFMENLESHMWAENGLSDEYQDGFSEAIAQIQEWVLKHKSTLEAPNGWEVTFVETRSK